MSWCDTCSEYREAETGSEQRICSTCSEPLSSSHVHDREATVGDSAPWHFWIVVVALAAYLLWRLVDGIAWLIG